MKFISIADLAYTIRKNFRKVPHDIDFVIGVPRSGVLAGSIIAEHLNVPLIDVDSFVFGAPPTGGRRVRSRMDFKEKPKVLVVDDTIFNGGSMFNARKKLEPLNDKYEFVFCAVYLEGPCGEVDVWLEDLRQYTEHFSSFVLYEWNILHHIPRVMKECMFDCDGVFCVDPPNDKYEDTYLEYIKNATPLFIPTATVGEIVSYRISKNEEITRNWLDSHGVKYERLTLFPAKTREERNSSGISPAQFKAKIYRNGIWAQLFVESDDIQAREIHRLSNKPVYCVGSNIMYE
jgi:hypoxanthine phosphoribosyltransferase